MPIFGRYLLKNYLKVLILSLFSFIAILLVSRFQEIAAITTMGAKGSYLMLFALYQILYILPISLPISCLIAAMILFQRLSNTYELTALRAGGLSLHWIISPVLIAGAFLALGNFYLTSELATASHLASRKKIYDLMSTNPLLLLQNAKIANLRGAYVQMDPVLSGKEAHNLFIILNNRSNKRLNLCLAKRIEMNGNDLLAEKVSLISSLPQEKDEGFDHLMIENQHKMSASADEFARMVVGNRGWKIANDHLKFSLLRIRKEHLLKEISTEANLGNRAKLRRHLEKSRTEIIRRVSLGLAAFTFTLMGVAYGMEISRNQTYRGIISVLILTALALIAFFIGKEFDHLFWIATLFFLLPHLIIVLCSIWTIRRVNKGIE